MSENKSTSGANKGFFISVSISLLIMIVSFVITYIYINEYKPEHNSAKNNVETTEVSENVESENTESENVESQENLENEDSGIKLISPNTTPVIMAIIGVFMFIIIIAFIVAKVVERKDEYM